MPRTELLRATVFVGLFAATFSVAAEPSTIHRVVAARQAAPGDGTFERFTVEGLPIVAPVNSKGQIAFFATVGRGRTSEGIFLASVSRVVKVAVAGDPAPGGGTFSGFGRHPIPALNEAGDIAFGATVAGGKTVEGIFLATKRRLQAVAIAGAPAPGISSAVFAKAETPALNDRGEVAFGATLRRGRESVEAIYLYSTTRTLRNIAAQGDPAPHGGTFGGFGPPSINNRGLVAFAAWIEGPAVPGGIFVADGEKLRMLVGAGEKTPLGGMFASLSERVSLNDAGVVAFHSRLKNAPAAAAIFVVENEQLRTVAGLGDEAPGGGRYSSFALWPSLSATGTVGFIASVDRRPAVVALFAATAGGTRKIVGVGDPLPGGGQLESFGLYPILSMSPAGGITFATAPSGDGKGVEGIFFVPPAP